LSTCRWRSALNELTHGYSKAADQADPASYDDAVVQQIWEAGQWDRRRGSPRAIAARGGVAFHLALVCRSRSKNHAR
jgi:hypothetical protein